MANVPLSTINVSGTQFQVTNSTFQKLVAMSDSNCLTEAIVTGTSPKEYFFERNAATFSAVLDYLRHGELHLPPSVCPNLFSRDLAFWGVDIARMQNCCYNNYVTFVEDRKTLLKFEKQALQNVILATKPPKTKLGQFRVRVWAVLEDPSSSVLAKMFMALVVVFVLASVFVIVASTHPLFQRKLSRSEWEEYLGDDFVAHLPSLKQFYEYWEEYYEDEDSEEGSGIGNDTYPDENILFVKPTTAAPVDDDKLSKAHARLEPLRYIEYACLIFFTVEFVLRVLFCPSFKAYFFNAINLLDFIALSALYVSVGLELFIPEKRFSATSYDLIQIVQFLRIFRFLRLVKNVTGFRVLVYSFTSSAKELLLLLSFLAIGVLVFGSVVFYAEDHHNMISIPDASWWALITMTTVGYGDMYPKTFTGKLIAAMCAISGVLLIAVTVPIFVNTFILFYNYSKVMDARALEASKSTRPVTHGFQMEKISKVAPVNKA